MSVCSVLCATANALGDIRRTTETHGRMCEPCTVFRVRTPGRRPRGGRPPRAVRGMRLASMRVWLIPPLGRSAPCAPLRLGVSIKPLRPCRLVAKLVLRLRDCGSNTVARTTEEEPFLKAYSMCLNTKESQHRTLRVLNDEMETAAGRPSSIIVVPRVCGSNGGGVMGLAEWAAVEGTGRQGGEGGGGGTRGGVGGGVGGRGGGGGDR